MPELETKLSGNVQFVFAHGWALEPDFFNPLITRLGILNPIFSSRDYFHRGRLNHGRHNHRSQDDSKASHSEWVGIGHSLGFLRLARSNLAGCRALVSLNGFTDFCAETGTDRRIIRRMHRKLQREPDSVVGEFRARCGPVVFKKPDSFNLELLSGDLMQLADVRINNSGEPLTSVADIPVLALAAADDPVVPPALSREQFQNLEFCPGGKHLLGSMFGYWCSLHIHQFLTQKVFRNRTGSK